MLAVTACLDGTPEYTLPTRAPPVIITSAVTPPTTEINLVPEGVDVVDFNVPFRSEDAPDDFLVYSFWKFLDPSAPEDTRNLLGGNRLPPDDQTPYDEQKGRTFSFTWPVERLGCVPVTLVLTHEENILEETLFTPKDEARAARITWWFYIPDPAGMDDRGCLPENPGGT